MGRCSSRRSKDSSVSTLLRLTFRTPSSLFSSILGGCYLQKFTEITPGCVIVTDRRFFRVSPLKKDHSECVGKWTRGESCFWNKNRTRGNLINRPNYRLGTLEGPRTDRDYILYVSRKRDRIWFGSQLRVQWTLWKKTFFKRKSKKPRPLGDLTIHDNFLTSKITHLNSL